MTQKNCHTQKRDILSILSQLLPKKGSLGYEMLLVTFLYVVFALLYTYPLVLNFASYVPGDMESDLWKHLWGMWWVKFKLIDECALPVYTNLLNAPYGGALFFIDSLNGFLSIPLQFIFSMPTVFNIVVIFNIVLANMGAYCLARYVTKSPYGAFFAGAVYGFSAYTLSNVASGITESINVGWIPFFCWMFLKVLRSNRLSHALWCGFFFGMVTLGCWYYGYFAILFMMFAFVPHFFKRYKSQLYYLVKYTYKALCFPWSGSQICLTTCLASLIFVYLWAVPDIELEYSFVNLTVFVLGISAFILSVLCLFKLKKDQKADVGPYYARLILLVPCFMVVTVLVGIFVFWILGVSAVAKYSSLFNMANCFLCCLIAFFWFSSVNAKRAFKQFLGEIWRNFSFILCCFLVVISGFTLFSESYLLRLSLRNVPVVLDMLLSKNVLSSWAFFLAVTAFALSFYSLFLSANDKNCILHKDAYANTDTLSLLDIFKYYLKRFYIFYAAILFVFWCLVKKILPLASPFESVFYWLLSVLLLQTAIFLLVDLFEYLKGFARSLSGNNPENFFKSLFLKTLLMPMIACIFGGLIFGGPALAFSGTLNKEGSIVFRGRTSDKVDLHLSRSFMNVVCLADYLRPGKDNASITYTVDKLTRSPYLGWVTFITAVFGLFVGFHKRRKAIFWWGIALTFAMFSLGPFLYITDDIYSKIKSPIYMAFFIYCPAFSQVSIPFRFVTLVMMSFGVLCAFSISGFFRGKAVWEKRLWTFALVMAMLTDVFMFSSAPYPMPLSSTNVPQYCYDLAKDTRSVGLIDFPIQRYKGELLPGEYFYYQMTHRKSIPNRVEGSIPVFVYYNIFTNYLFLIEHAKANLPPKNDVELMEGLKALVQYRFRYLVIHDHYLKGSSRDKIHAFLQYYLGMPKSYPDGIYVYQLPDVIE